MRRSLQFSRQEIEQKTEAIFGLKLKKQKAQLGSLFEKETEELKKEIADLKEKINSNNTAVSDSKKQAESLQKQWELDLEKSLTVFGRKKEKIQEHSTQVSIKIEGIDAKLLKNKESLYGWLNENVPGWENTIGKVIDEEDVLFHPALAPQFIENTGNTLFGVKIDLDEINRTVKTVADYERDKLDLKQLIESNNTALNTLSEQEKEDADKLRRKYQPKIKDARDTGYQAEYALTKAKEQLQEKECGLEEIAVKAAEEKVLMLALIEADLMKAREELATNQQNYNTIDANLQTQLGVKEKEQKRKINAEEERITGLTNLLDSQLVTKTSDIKKHIEELKEQQSGDLKKEGADTNRIADIEIALDGIRTELDFIESNGCISKLRFEV
ncbi:hypothetical protein DSL64_02875 [Dyadobacter luteus]|uniref:Uncharacterized protein n=1 Tax=Dyadobacter luteus TaxID=2259619 RepID=A0A3D8YGB8_9BACT|nr:ATP-binding protein [Dyadobacter luteus]REA63406.1 hypothetical protein DSL64_02875 [Dyadobacter luteus]